MATPKILIIPGSLRTGSHNAKLAAVIAYEFARAGVDVTRISLADFPLPIYDGDLQARSGVPINAINLKRMVGGHQGAEIRTHHALEPIVQAFGPFRAFQIFDLIVSRAHRKTSSRQITRHLYSPHADNHVG